MGDENKNRCKTGVFLFKADGILSETRTAVGKAVRREKNRRLQREDVQYLDEHAEEDAEGDDGLWVDVDGVAVLGVEVSDESGTGHQSAGVLTTAHVRSSVRPSRKPFGARCGWDDVG